MPRRVDGVIDVQLASVRRAVAVVGRQPPAAGEARQLGSAFPLEHLAPGVAAIPVGIDPVAAEEVTAVGTCVALRRDEQPLDPRGDVGWDRQGRAGAHRGRGRRGRRGGRKGGGRRAGRRERRGRCRRGSERRRRLRVNRTVRAGAGTGAARAAAENQREHGHRRRAPVHDSQPTPSSSRSRWDP